MYVNWPSYSYLIILCMSQPPYAAQNLEPTHTVRQGNIVSGVNDMKPQLLSQNDSKKKNNLNLLPEEGFYCCKDSI